MSSVLLAVPVPLLKVTAKIKNTGLSYIVFDLSGSGLRILAAEQRTRDSTDQLSWERLATLDFTDQHTWIEPAETIEVNWLIELNDNVPRQAYRAQLTIAGKRTVWKADSIATP